MSNSMFHYGGLGLASFSLIQLITFLGETYPHFTALSSLLLGLIFIGILIAGGFNWINLRMQGYRGKDHWVVGFFPSLVLLPLFLAAFFGGVYIAHGFFTLF